MFFGVYQLTEGIMHRKVAWLLLAAVLVLTLGAAQTEKSYSAPRFEVFARIQEGGSLEVEETVTFQFEGGPFSTVFRELPLDFTDGIRVVSAGVDGQIWPQGSAPGQVEISGTDPVRIEWHLPPTSNATHDFDLHYQMSGVVHQGDGADRLKWIPLPSEHEYFITNSQVAVNYHPEAQLTGQPIVSLGTVEPATETGLTVFTAANLAANQSPLIEMGFYPGTFITEPPQWQQNQMAQAEHEARRDELAWIWLLMAAALGLGGLTVLVVVWSGYRRPSPSRSSLAYEAPADLSPAIAGALRKSSADPDWNQALGTLFDLAGRDYLTIEELPAEKWYQSKDFLLRRSEPEESSFLLPHERMLLALVFTTKSGHQIESSKLSKLGQLITSSRWKRYADSVRAEMKAMGLMDRSRQDVRRNLMIPGGILLFLALVAVLLEILLYEPFGLWPLAVAGVLLLLGIASFITAASISIWSENGLKLAAEWEPYYRYLRGVSRGKSGASHEQEFDRHLPYVAAYGLLHGWAKRFEKDGYDQVPAYFRSASSAGSNQMAAFVAMTAATSSSGGSAAGAGAAGGAAGAAGGGASGAS